MTWRFRLLLSSAKSLVCNSDELFDRADLIIIYKKHRDNWGQQLSTAPGPQGNMEMQKKEKQQQQKSKIQLLSSS